MKTTGPFITLWRRVWTSPTMMTWGSHLSRSLSLLLVVPLILTRLDTADIALWYLFSTIIVLQGLADAGFSPTFARVLAYALGGIAPDQLKDLRKPVENAEGEPNWQTVAQICATMRVIYTRLTLVAMAALGTLGTWAVAHPIAQSPDSEAAWMAWGVILLGSTVMLRGNTYSAYLQGMNRIALLRRWEALTSLGAILTSFTVLLMGGGLLGLVIAHQCWMVLNVLRNRWLCRTIDGGRFKTFSYEERARGRKGEREKGREGERGTGRIIGLSFRKKAVDPTVFAAIWPSAWRSGLGIAMSFGLIQLSGIIYAQLGSTEQVAMYLLSLQLMTMTSRFSQAPFYSKLPLLARLRALGDTDEQVRLAQRGMALSHWTFVLGFVGLGLFATPLLGLIGSNAAFADPLLWALLGLGTLLERYGAMHIQLYSTTNHIIWHVANGVSGTIYLVVSLLLYHLIGVYAFPAGILVGYAGFYSWYAARHSYRTFPLRLWSFERATVLKPLTLMAIYVTGSLLL